MPEIQTIQDEVPPPLPPRAIFDEDIPQTPSSDSCSIEEPPPVPVKKSLRIVIL